MSNVGDDTPHGRGSPQPRKGNGLPAADYRAIADLDPGLGAHLLEVMRLKEIAAYLQPAHNEQRSASHHLPERPLERLYVDRGRAAEATTVARDEAERFTGTADTPTLVVLTEEEADSEEQASAAWDPVPDEEWAALVAQLEGPPPAGDVTAAAEPAATPPSQPPGLRAVDVGGLTFLERRAPDPPEPAPEGVSDDEDHYEPPPPPPLPQLSQTARWGVRAIVAGVVLLLLPVVAGWQASELLLTLAIGCIAGGSVALLSRLRDGPPADDGWDDGAVL